MYGIRIAQIQEAVCMGNAEYYAGRIKDIREFQEVKGIIDGPEA